jgi:hypothetical protein
MPALVGQCVGLGGGRRLALSLQQGAKVEGAVEVSALKRAAIAGLGLQEVAAALQQHTEVERGSGVPPRVGVAVRHLGGVHVAALLQHQPQVEPLDGVSGLVACLKLSPRHLPLTGSLAFAIPYGQILTTRP